MSNQNVAECLVSALQDVGVKYVFGVPSGGWVDYMEALRRADGIDFILTTHEGAAGMMADVCGRLGGAPGACFGTFGPGATNLATGVGEALLDRSPMLAFTDEFPLGMRGRTTQMGIDHQALFRPLTKHTTRLEANNVRSTIFKAAHLAMSGRPGPVHIGLPVGLSAEKAGAEEVRYLPPSPAFPAGAAQIEAAQRMFAQARKPVLAIGLGAVHAGITDDIAAFSTAHNLPVVLTPMAKGMLPENHPCYTGVLFHALSDIVGKTHREADLVIAAGYDPVEFNFESWMPAVPLINLDIVPADIEDKYDTLSVIGDIRASMQALHQVKTFSEWDLTRVSSRKNEIFDRLSPGTGTFGPIAALDVLRSTLPNDGIMTCDVGGHTHLIGQQWPTPAPGRQIMTNGWSTMGFGLPAAIAAKLSRPTQPVCCVVGDGGFLMTAGEIATAVRLNLNIVIIVLTDNDLALIRIKQEKKGNPVYGTPVRAKGTIGGKNIFGAPVLSADNADEFRAAIDEAFAKDGPVIVEALVDSREYDNVVLKKDRS